MTTTGTVDWTAVASGWDAHRGHVEGMKEELSRRLLAQLDLQPGDRVLELGAGTGELARQLAAAVGPLGHVTGDDVAQGMVELQRKTLAGLDNAEVARLDAFDTGREAGTFDAVVFRMGLMLVDDPPRVLRECHRLLAQGGRLAVAVWAGPEHNPWMTCVGMAAMMHGLVSGGPPTGPGGMFSLSDPAVLERVVADHPLEDCGIGQREHAAGARGGAAADQAMHHRRHTDTRHPGVVLRPRPHRDREAATLGQQAVALAQHPRGIVDQHPACLLY